MKKKLLLALCVVVFGTILFGMMGASAETEGVFTYSVSDGEATITACETSVSGELVIPDTLGGYPVTTIDRVAFSWCTGLTKVTIPNSVTTVNYRAFARCTGMESITIPDSVTTISQDAFYYCSGLTSINVDPNNTTYCSVSGVLFDKGQTTLICYPAGKTEREYTIPDGVTTIGPDAFFYCTNLTTVNIPDSVAAIDGTAFCYSTVLTDINVDADNTTYSSVSGVLFDEAQTTLICYPSGKTETEYIIPNGVTTIGERAFYDCKGLVSIAIPDSVTTISTEAFIGCSGLKSVSLGASVATIGDYAFSHCEELTSIIIPSSVTAIGNYVFDYCNNLKGVYYAGSREDWEGISFGKGNEFLSGSVILFNVSAEAGSYLTYSVSDGKATIIACDTLASGGLVIPPTLGGYPVTAIGDYAFYGCAELTGVAIPDSVARIGEYAFGLCAGLTDITIPECVTTIGEFAFYGCDGLTSIRIHKNVASIGFTAFGNCSGLKEIVVDAENAAYIALDGVLFDKAQTTILCYPAGKTGTEYSIPDGITTIAEGAFIGCSGLTSVTVPKSVTTIGHHAFYHCTGLISINVDADNGVYSSQDGVLFDKAQANLICYPAGKTETEYSVPVSVTAIVEGAFYDCAGLTGIIIPGNVMVIGEEAFKNCTGLTSVDIAEGVISIGNSAFYGCTALTDITLPDSVTIIESYLFRDCTGLESVTLGENVTTIGENAFCNCTSLTDMIIPDSVTTIGGFAFYGCEGLTDITIPDSVTTLGNSAFFGCSGLKTITIPDSITTLGNWVFGWCTGLEIITFEKSVTTIGDYAFYNCPAMREVRFVGTPAEWEAISVGDNNEEFLNAAVHFVGKTETVVSNDGKTFQVTLINMETGKMVILALYKNGVLVDAQQMICEDDAVTFTTGADYNKAKVMVWDDLESLTPVCPAEVVK